MLRKVGKQDPKQNDSMAYISHAARISEAILTERSQSWEGPERTGADSEV